MPDLTVTGLGSGSKLLGWGSGNWPHPLGQPHTHILWATNSTFEQLPRGHDLREGKSCICSRGLTAALSSSLEKQGPSKWAQREAVSSIWGHMVPEASLWCKVSEWSTAQTHLPSFRCRIRWPRNRKAVTAEQRAVDAFPFWAREG